MLLSYDIADKAAKEPVQDLAEARKARLAQEESEAIRRPDAGRRRLCCLYLKGETIFVSLRLWLPCALDPHIWEQCVIRYHQFLNEYILRSTSQGSHDSSYTNAGEL